MEIKEAIILAAGKGSRLYPITKNITKCMVKVKDITIIDNTLDKLLSSGVEKVTIIVGYLQNILKNHVGNNYKGMEVKYIINEEFEESNSIYSLYLGLKNQKNSTWVLESDIFIGNNILDRDGNNNEITWYVDSSIHDIEGSYVCFNENNQIIKHEIIRDLNVITTKHAKSMGILCIHKDAVKTVENWLEEEMKLQGKNIYYDLALGKHLNEDRLYVKDNKLKKWWEIDDLEDLNKAKELFK
ncbi:phosphocholine cytidylyltransferase family protein [Clostridium butyricum]|uniref:Lysis protein n=1 Tax=Clostridium butyricum TaxID=1492 RepID=A0A0A6PZD0_CLOBU|nr:phosphocholine cytidylyltransferase family protein [Clostridium butyricum]KHD13526.1 lysis protein [Clostridium butyricum]KHD15794.1 lysis protein [Clostridium butyricum]PPV14665.1 lysis protein [Clostridium butyricum]